MKYVITLALVLFYANTTQANQSLTLDDLMASPLSDRANVPSPFDVLSTSIGERHLHHHEIIHYLDTLAEASPRIVPLGPHATSYGGRDLVSYAISSPKNIERLSAIKASRAAIVDADARVDLQDQPVVVHMMYSIHGNEPSGANAAPLVAYYLASSNDPKLLEQLDTMVIIFNPMLNPDGLDRFANWSNNHRGANPSADPNDREHREHTPNGRTNYYGFDLNRDWLPHQHPESRGRLALFHEWKPNVQLDFHEQGSNSSYFFMPGKPERTNPLTPPINQQLTAKIGEYHAKALDEAGVLYFSGENYDDFFMGKGSTYPDLFGSVGILFEQPSSRGAQQDTINGLLTFEESIANQFRTSLSSIAASADLKDQLLAYQRDFYRDNAASSVSGYYLAASPGDPTRLREFVRILQGHDIVVESLSSDAIVDGVTYRANETIAIPAKQANSHYLRTLWERQLEFEENVFYDVSTWTLPLAFDLVHTLNPAKKVKTTALKSDFSEAGQSLPSSNIGYLIDWRDAGVPELLYDLLDAEANVRVAQKTFTAQVIDQGLVSFSYGTLFVSAELAQALPTAALELLEEAATAGLPVYAAGSSYTPDGIDLGSRGFTVIHKPKVVLVTGEGTSPHDTGEVWHLLDRVVNMPFTMIDVHRLSRVNLNAYTHVILTDPIKSAGDNVIKQLDAFTKAGGTVWAQNASTIEWLGDHGLVTVRWRETAAEQEKRTLAEASKKANANSTELEQHLPQRRAFVTAEDEAAFRLVRGVILEGNLDTTHPLGYGYSDEQLPIFRRNNRFMARSGNAYSTPLLYSAAPLMSGYMSIENQTLAAESAGLIVDANGAGAFVLSLDNPSFRAFWWGSRRVLLNAIFFGDLLEEPR